MFNPMEPHELVLGVGRVSRQAADPNAADDDYRRGQLLSAYSVARHLAAEQRSGPALFAEFSERIRECLADSTVPATAEIRAAVGAATRPAELGTALTRLFADLGDDAAARALSDRLHRLLAEMTDREVAVLAEAEA